MRILFLFIGEPHHLFHALPIAAEMAAMGRAPEIAVSSADHLPILTRLADIYPDFRPQVRILGRSGPAAIVRRMKLSRNPRIPTLIGALPYLRGFDAIVVPERTTTAIRHFLPRRTKLIFTPHGAGDRAIMLDPRDRHFDFVLVAGEKSERRLLEAGTIRPGHYATNGYVKLDLMLRMQKQRSPLFDNDRQTVLYAPHFRRSLSSWDRFGPGLIDWFRRQDRYNLVVAPHVRLFADAPQAAKDAVMALAQPGKILIDLDSDRLFDMSYTSGADIYLGDVSSQVYEFLAFPRPCLFLNAHGVSWRDDPDYLFWTLGDVLDDLASLPDALDRAGQRHGFYADAQRNRVAESVGGDPHGAARRGAEAICAFLEKARR
ncbi:CDP-glycerol glycerophosphotransferase family protein [Sphingobium sp. JS3065]|uniref:CDP-glycerol glycerophosphotransferase family protein n=1 Tax=Sphingobium sp. JS3065 TaxID=2970925 RepID=UPI002265153A|nr:CDP-glycerol glycerophosphotransferase family protein [Sphingobium sp. JS3065]UZW53774.1 CDP-glycerol glycerophosphotransferase family protein [Sphingobium sp. JS3065]